jgi:nucleoside-diphosphate-sugar epimerase
MRVAVIGGTGNVGLALVERLARNPDITGTVAISRRQPDQLPAGVEWRAGDLADGVEHALGDVDAVVHLAWLFQPTHAPETTWSSNVVGTARLLHWLGTEARVKTLVYASSLGAYSPDLRGPVDETAPTHGIVTSSYSVEKAYAERMLDAFEARHPGTRVVRMRPAFIIGAEAAVEQRRLFGGPFAPGRTIGRWGLPLLPDPGVRFQVLHRTDAARAYELALTRNASGAFNLAADPPVDVRDVADCLGGRAVRVPAGVVRTAVTAAWHAHLVPLSPGIFDLVARTPLLDTTRARDELGWQPQHTPKEALADLVRGLAANTGGPTPPLSPDTSGPLRAQEFRTGLGERP